MTHSTFSTQQHSTRLAAHYAGIDANSLWSHYVSISRHLGPLEINAYLHGLVPAPLDERNTIAMALNELIDDLPPQRRAEVLSDSPSAAGPGNQVPCVRIGRRDPQRRTVRY